MPSNSSETDLMANLQASFPAIESHPWHCEGCGCMGIINALSITAASRIHQRMVMAHDDLRPTCTAHTGRKVVEV